MKTFNKQYITDLCIDIAKDVMSNYIFEEYNKKTFNKIEFDIAKKIVKETDDLNFSVDVNGNKNNIYVTISLLDYETKINASYDNGITIYSKKQNDDFKFNYAMKILE